MTSKFAVGAIFGDQLDTLVDATTGRRRPADILTLFGLPTVIGIASYWFDWQLNGISSVLAGMAIFTALLFGLVVWVFQLRVDIGRDPSVPPTSTLTRLVDELFANVLYAVGAGILTVGSIVAQTSTAPVSPSGTTDPASRIWSAIILALIVHFLLALAMCLKRVRSAYQQIRRG